jgi:hypothetical protein
MDKHISSPDDFPPITSQDDLHGLWQTLMGPLGFGGHSLWLLLLDGDRRPTPTLLQIEDPPPLPDLKVRSNLTDFLAHLVSPGDGSVAFLLTRPGRTPITAGERQWAQALGDVVRRAGLPSWPVHRANDLELVAITPDDLAASA